MYDDMMIMISYYSKLPDQKLSLTETIILHSILHFYRTNKKWKTITVKNCEYKIIDRCGILRFSILNSLHIRTYINHWRYRLCMYICTFTSNRIYSLSIPAQDDHILFPYPCSKPQHILLPTRTGCGSLTGKSVWRSNNKLMNATDFGLIFEGIWWKIYFNLIKY